ncbi:MAG: hypothetical protein KF768_13250 [Phycisphaeraceae bacterium]|nr:hypothetical protein [Phycisphaeraceae bacterium]
MSDLPRDMRPPLVLQTEHLDDEPARWLAERCRLEVTPSDSPRFNELLPHADALLIRTYTRVNDALLDRAPKLRCVARAGVGLDNVDLAACARRGVAVVSTPAANTQAVVEYVFAMLLDVLRPRLFLDKAVAPADWKRLRTELLAPRQLGDLSLGVLGLGRVGSGVARVGLAFGMRVRYHDLIDFPPGSPQATLRSAGAEPVPLDELLRSSDVLSLHVDGRRANRALINAQRLSLCKPDAIILNTSRGFVIDPAALADFLIANKAASALLDVHEPEPFDATYPLLDLPNAHLAPHIAAATATAHRNMSWVVRDLWRVLQGEPPEHPASPEPA